MAFGAPRSTWDRFSVALGLTADLLPVVSNPKAVIAKHSTMKDIGKTPSVLNADREVVGLGKWTRRESDDWSVRRWAREPDYGICIQTRRVRAFDIDVPDGDAATAIAVTLAEAIGVILPQRYRKNSGKCLFAFRLEQEAHFPKRVLPVEGGIVELLGDGQQFIAAGTHPSGAAYEWEGGLPETIPALTLAQVEEACTLLRLAHGTADWKIAKERRLREDLVLETSDERAEWLAQNWDIFETGGSGELFLRCPFEEDHTSDSGITSTAYFPRGTGGFEQGHWVCLHAHCMDRSDAEFDEKAGYRYANFSALPAIVETVVNEEGEHTLRTVDDWPTFTRSPLGKITTDSGTLQKALAHPGFCGMWITYDTFLDDLMWAPPEQMAGRQQWQRFLDKHYHDLRLTLEARGFMKLSKELLRDGVEWQAHNASMDSAQVWLSRHRWDGVSRIDQFLTHYFGVETSDYAVAVSRYMWSAMAGRVLTPGVQADMVPVLCGEQGARKTTAIKRLVPSPTEYVEINLAGRDDNLSRKLRGKLVGELEELRGLQSRDAEDIKAWITRTHEEWVPKFKERPFTFARRLLLLGTTNHRRFLADGTGERRWLPSMVATHGPIRVDEIDRDRDQLWAEAALLYRLDGVQWADAERLAKREHHKFKVRDSWADAVEAWASSPNVAGIAPVKVGFSTGEALSGLGIALAHANKAQADRMERVLRDIGLTERGDGTWA